MEEAEPELVDLRKTFKRARDTLETCEEGGREGGREGEGEGGRGEGGKEGRRERVREQRMEL